MASLSSAQSRAELGLMRASLASTLQSRSLRVLRVREMAGDSKDVVRPSVLREGALVERLEEVLRELELLVLEKFWLDGGGVAEDGSAGPVVCSVTS